ncbi:MAG: hypothetical protein ABEJ03_02530 [Candidatus Nanohaloarchaea archaeon]
MKGNQNGENLSEEYLSAIDDVIDREIDQIIDEKVEQFLRNQEITGKIMKSNVSRRFFIKVLGLGAGGVALASSGLAASLLQDTTVGGYDIFHQGNDYSGSGSSSSALDADTVDGKDAGEIGGNTSVNSSPSNQTGDLGLSGGNVTVGGNYVTLT